VFRGYKGCVQVFEGTLHVSAAFNPLGTQPRSSFHSRVQCGNHEKRTLRLCAVLAGSRRLYANSK